MIKDFTRTDGFLPIYQKDDRFFLELRESDLDKPMFYAIQRTHGIGERGLWGGMMVDSGISFFRKFGTDRVQWVEKTLASSHLATSPWNAPSSRDLQIVC